MSSTSKKITLKSSDGEQFEISENVALESVTLKHTIEVECVDGVIPIPNVAGSILAIMVIEYCKKHVESSESDLKNWDAEFVSVGQATLLPLILAAANYLNIKGLFDLTCRTQADRIKVKPVEEIRKILNIKNDYTPEKEEEYRRENKWAFE